MFSKIDVNGDDAHPLWKYLKKQQGGFMGEYVKLLQFLKLPQITYLWHFFLNSVWYISFIKWNFTKFIVDKNGIPVARHATTTDPIVIRFKNQNVFPNAYIYLF